MGRIGILRDMRKRRVGVTARSRLIVGNQATGTPQIVTEIAAPLELRTPMGTVAKAANRVRMEAWRYYAREDQSGRRTIQKEDECRERNGAGGSDRRAERAHEALPHTPPGGKPPETPAPFPSGSGFFRTEGICQGFASRARSGAPLTDSLRSEETIAEMRERGPLARARSLPLVGSESARTGRRATRA